VRCSARVGPIAHQGGFEIEVEAARRLAETDSPVGELVPQIEPRVYLRDDFAISLWIYYEPVVPSGIAPADYADALMRIHAGLRRIDLVAPRFSDHVAARQRLVAAQELTPELLSVDRDLISTTLSRLSTAIISAATSEQLLHGEPHPGNVLITGSGPLFIDLATCCYGPIEYDLAFVPDEVRDHYSGTNSELIHQCSALMWAMFAAQRWSRDDQIPNRNYWRIEGLNRLRVALDRGY
jgi:aminoglycoside phosphotransferase (APT) family kinase protein